MAKAATEKAPRERRERPTDAMVVKVDPYDPLTGLLVPFVAQRIIETSKLLAPESSPDSVARGVLPRLYQGDPSQLVLAILNEDNHVVGHAVAQMGMDHGACWATVMQIRADQNVGLGQKAALDAIRQWAQRLGATKLVLVTGRGDKGWEEEYGFRLSRQVKVADITLGASTNGAHPPG